MKKILAMMMALMMCLSLCACGGTAKLTEAEVTNALADCDGVLNVETDGSNVVGFTYVVEEVNADDLIDKDYTREAVDALLSGKVSEMTFGQFKVSKAFSPLVCIEALLTGESDDFDANTMTDKLLGVICDGKTAEYDNWKLSAVVDQENDSMTISVVSK